MSDSISRHGTSAWLENMGHPNLAKMIMDEKQFPSAQPNIICCKDCKHWDTSWQNDYAPDYHYCPMIDETRRSDFYCADAERKVTE